MELFAKLFCSLLVFVYHCFDRIVIHGYLSGLSRPEQVVYFFRDVIGVPVVDKAVLSKRTGEYRGWVEAFARNHKIPMEWAEKGVRKEDYVRPRLRRMERAGQYGVYFIFQSMEQGPTFRCSMPKFPTQDPNHRILRPQRSRFTHYYFYLRDETLGPMVMRVASFFPFQATYYLNGHSFIEQELNRNKIGFRKNDNAFLAVDDVAALQAAADRLTGEVIRERLDYWTLLLGPKFSKRERGAMNLHRFYAVNQIEYCRNFIFKRHFPIHRIFERSCEIGLWRLTAHKISEIFGVRVTKKLKGKLNTTLEQIEHGHHIFRAYFKHAFVKQYEKFSIFLRNEICSNNLSDFRLKKGLDHLAAVREKFLAITDRFATFQAQCVERSRRVPALAAAGVTDRGGNREVPRHQDPRHAHDPAHGDPAAWRHYGRRVDRQADPRRPPDRLPTLRCALRLESTPLRSAQNEGAWADRAGRQTVRLPADRKGDQGRPHLCAVPPAVMRAPRKQPLSPPAQQRRPAQQ